MLGDDQDQIVCEKRVPNKLENIPLLLRPYKPTVQTFVVESTFNWYWLVDGLMEAGYPVQLANIAAINNIEG